MTTANRNDRDWDAVEESLVCSCPPADPRTAPPHADLCAHAALARLRARDEALDKLIEMAWVIIANAGEGSWTSQTGEWQAAALKWREDFFAASLRAGSGATT